MHSHVAIVLCPMLSPAPLFDARQECDVRQRYPDCVTALSCLYGEVDVSSVSLVFHRADLQGFVDEYLEAARDVTRRALAGVKEHVAQRSQARVLYGGAMSNFASITDVLAEVQGCDDSATQMPDSSTCCSRGGALLAATIHRGDTLAEQKARLPMGWPSNFCLKGDPLLGDHLLGEYQWPQTN